MDESIRVLVVDDDESISIVMSKLLMRNEMQVRTARTGAAALEALSNSTFDIILLDLRMPDVDGFGVLRALKALGELPAVLIHSAYLDIKTVTRLMREGAMDVVEKPCNLSELVEKMQHCAKVIRARRQVKRLHPAKKVAGPLSRLIGGSAAMVELRHQIECVAAFPHVSVLIDGPTGTGKELVARSIHELTSPDSPLVTVNCAAIPEQLLESELYGHVNGAFTSARGSRTGLFEEAKEGTIFLDEIGEMPQALQSKLLRVLETREFRPVGSNQTKKLKARVVSATNRGLSPHEPSALRQDLYFRLAGYTVRPPLLAHRLEDIPELTSFFLQDFAQRHGLSAPTISAEALASLASYPWPGNVRELRRCVENLAMVTRGQAIGKDDVDSTLWQRTANDDVPVASSRVQPTVGSESRAIPAIELPPIKKGKRDSLPELERAHILEVYEAHGGNVTRAAKTLGIARSTLRERIRKYRSARG